jgi:hypothetical protein
MFKFKIPVIKPHNPFKRPSTTGSTATALHPTPVEASLAQGSGSLQASEAISYGPVPLQYASGAAGTGGRAVVPLKKNVGKPINQHSHFVVPTVQRNQPPKRAKVKT